MNKSKIRQIIAYALLLFLAIMFIATIIAFIFYGFEAGIAMFAYNAVFSVLIFFFLTWQKRSQAKSTEDEQEPKE